MSGHVEPWTSTLFPCPPVVNCHPPGEGTTIIAWDSRLHHQSLWHNLYSSHLGFCAKLPPWLATTLMGVDRNLDGKNERVLWLYAWGIISPDELKLQQKDDHIIVLCVVTSCADCWVTSMTQIHKLNEKLWKVETQCLKALQICPKI